VNPYLRNSDLAKDFSPTEIEGFDSLAELALNMRWSWNHATDEVWRQLDPKLWEITHNPWVVLQTASRDQIKLKLAELTFRKQVDGLVQTRRQAAAAPAWFQQNHPRSPLTCVAYFSMEFMLSEALPIYSGGLGNVAGDQLKATSDLGVPVIGVGLLYHITTQDNYRSRLCVKQMGSGCVWRLLCPVTRSGCVPGRFRSAEASFTSWTVMMQRISLLIGELPASYMAAAQSYASNKSCFWGSVVGGC
jgi:hypothetical protein